MFRISCKVELYIKNAVSLKDKRKHLKSLITKLKNRYNISIAEIDKQNAVKHAVIGIVSISSDKKHLEHIIDKCLDFIDYIPDLMIIKSTKEIW